MAADSVGSIASRLIRLRVMTVLLGHGAVLIAVAAVLVSVREAEASHGNLNVHIHDDYNHPAGAFLVMGSTDHSIAKANCEVANPPATCDAVIHVGDTITWVAPAPLAVNVHTVTECTDNTFSVCGAGTVPTSPIDDSGFRQPPSPGPSGWPYGPIQFNAPGIYYYRCDVHPAVMRSRIRVTALSPAVGGIARAPEVRPLGASTEDGGGVSTSWILGGSAAALIMLVGAGAALSLVRARRS